MVFAVLYLVTGFELVLYGVMVANRQWLFSSSYRQRMAYQFGVTTAAADGDDDFDYDSLVMDY